MKKVFGLKHNSQIGQYVNPKIFNILLKKLLTSIVQKPLSETWSIGMKRVFVCFVSIRWINWNQIPYAHNYKPRLVYFYPIFKDHFFIFKEVFSENSVLMYGLYSRAAYNQERLMMARVRYTTFFFLFSRNKHILGQIINGVYVFLTI